VIDLFGVVLRFFLRILWDCLPIHKVLKCFYKM